MKNKIVSVIVDKDDKEFIFNRRYSHPCIYEPTASSSARWRKLFIRKSGNLLLPYSIPGTDYFEYRVQPEGRRRITSVIIPIGGFDHYCVQIVRNNALLGGKKYKRVTLKSFARLVLLLAELCRQNKARNRIHDTFVYGKKASITKITREEGIYRYDF